MNVITGMNLERMDSDIIDSLTFKSHFSKFQTTNNANKFALIML